MFEKIKDILKDYVEVPAESIVPEANLVADLGLNSLDVINLVLDFEDMFGVEIPDEDIGRFVTVQDVVEYVENRKK